MPQLIPVDHDPFGDDPAAADQGAMMPETFVPQVMRDWAAQAAPKDLAVLQGLGRAVVDTATIPQRAIEAAQADAQHFGESGYVPRAVGPATEAAMLTMGATPLGAAARSSEVMLGAGPVRRLPGSTTMRALGGEMTADERAALAAQVDAEEAARAAHFANLKARADKAIASGKLRPGEDYLTPSQQRAADKRQRQIAADEERMRREDAAEQGAPKLIPVDHDPFAGE